MSSIRFGVGINCLLIGFISGNAKWPFSLSKVQLNTGGWVRQQNGTPIRFLLVYFLNLSSCFVSVQQMPIATGQCSFVFAGPGQAST